MFITLIVGMKVPRLMVCPLGYAGSVEEPQQPQWGAEKSSRRSRSGTCCESQRDRAAPATFKETGCRIISPMTAFSQNGALRQ